MSMTAVVQVMTRFATDLKSKHEGVRNKAAKDLYTYVTYKYSPQIYQNTALLETKIQPPARIKYSYKQINYSYKLIK